jgi:hypothetical protein
MARYKVTVEIQFELIEREVIVEANSEDQAKKLAEIKVDQSTCSDDFGEAEVSSSSARRVECVDPPVYEPDQLIV